MVFLILTVAYLLTGVVIGTHFVIWACVSGRHRDNPLFWITMGVGALLVGPLYFGD